MALSRDDVIELMRAKQGERSLREFGKEADCSAAYLSDIYRGKRDPGPAILQILRLERNQNTTVSYARIKTKRSKA